MENIKKRFFLAALLFIVPAGHVICMDNSNTWGAAGIIFGSMELKPFELNASLSKNGYPEILRKLPLLGIGGFICDRGQNLFGLKLYRGSYTAGISGRSARAVYAGSELASYFGPKLQNQGFIGIYFTIGGFDFSTLLSKLPSKQYSSEELMGDPSLLSAAEIKGRSYSVGIGVNAFVQAGLLALGIDWGRQYYPGYDSHTVTGTETPDFPAIRSAKRILFSLFYGSENMN